VSKQLSSAAKLASLLAAGMLASAACAAGIASPDPSPPTLATPSQVVVQTPSPTEALGTPIAEASPAPVCSDLKPAWVQAAHSVKDGPDPAGRIVFGQVSRADVYSQVVDPLFAIDPDGSDLTQILNCEVERPRISHDGTRLAFSIFMTDRTWQVATSTIDGRDLRLLTSTSGWASMPDWAPDDSWLVYSYSPRLCNIPTCVEDEGFHQALWRVNPDGSDQRLLGDGDAYDSEARLSPDGREVVFDHFDASKQLNMFMIRDLATGAERRVTTTNTGGEHPDWTRDSRSIVYNTTRDSNTGNNLELIQTVPADDPTAKPTTLHSGYKPAYSPDGSRIVFGCDGNLCLMNADGSNVVTLAHVAGQDELNHFAWGVAP
jgi:Tol biopolymer transport system component